MPAEDLRLNTHDENGAQQWCNSMSMAAFSTVEVVRLNCPGWVITTGHGGSPEELGEPLRGYAGDPQHLSYLNFASHHTHR